MLEEFCGHSSIGIPQHAEINFDGELLDDENRTPEEKLLIAVILRAIVDLWLHRFKVKHEKFHVKRKHGETEERLKKRKEWANRRFGTSRYYHDSAEYWFKDKKNLGPFSFNYCCFFLNYNPIRLRKIILAGPPKDFKLD